MRSNTCCDTALALMSRHLKWRASECSNSHQPYQCNRAGLLNSLPPLYRAGGTGDVDELARLLDAGVDALWYAADAGDPGRVAALLALGGDPHAVSTAGRNVIAVAARRHG